MPSLRRRAVALALVLAAPGCAGPNTPPPPAVAGPLVVQGMVNYRQRVALPPNAVVWVQLVDAARADVATRVVAEQAIATQGGQVPFAFALRAPAGTLTPAARLRLQARIEVDGALRFVTTAAYPVTAANAGRPIELIVQPVTSRPSR